MQILKHGFLHSDPHPGNIAVNPEGHLIFYDFGMMSSIVPATKERLLDVFYGIYRKDAAQVGFSLKLQRFCKLLQVVVFLLSLMSQQLVWHC